MGRPRRVITTSKEGVRGIHEFNVRQKKCWAMVVNELQPYTKLPIKWDTVDANFISKFIPLNDYGVLEIEINPGKIVSKKHNRQEALVTIQKLTEVWLTSNNVKDGMCRFVLFSSYRVTKDNRYFVSIGVQALCWLLNFSRTNSFSTFHLPSFLRLSSTYSMDIYLFLSENYHNPHFTIKISDFIKRIKCPENFNAQRLRDRVLNPSIKEFEKKKTLLTFDYKFILSEESTGGRRGYNRIEFNVWLSDFTKEEIDEQ